MASYPVDIAGSYCHTFSNPKTLMRGAIHASDDTANLWFETVLVVGPSSSLLDVVAPSNAYRDVKPNGLKLRHQQSISPTDLPSIKVEDM